MTMQSIKVINSLTHLINTGDEVERCYAVKILGIIGNTQAIPILVQCLRDEDIDVAIDAVEALGCIGESTVVPPLLESLTHDQDGEVKTAVVKALAKIDSTDGIAALLEVAKACPADMAWDENNEWNAWWDMQLQAVKALGNKRVKEAVPVLTAILTDEDNQDIESEVLIALAFIGDEGNNILIKRLANGSDRERRRAATALGLSNSTDAHKALARALLDKNCKVRVAAIHALSKQNAIAYLDIMLRFLNDPDPEVRHAVIEVITTLAANQANVKLAKLLPLLSDPNPKIRIAILQALDGIEDISPQTLTQIRQCLSDQNSNVMSAALTLLTQLGDQEISLTLLQILSNQEHEANLRSQAAMALGKLGNIEALTILTWAIKDNVQAVRLAALNALMQLEQTCTNSVCSSEESVQSKQPLDVIIAALKGEIVAPVADSTPELTEEPPEVAESPPDQVENSMSTLEAIHRNNAAALTDKQTPEDATELLQEAENVATDMQEYMQIAQKNIQLGERLFVTKKLDIATDVRHLSARILGSSDKAVQALVAVLADDDLKLRREVITSLGLIAQRSPQLEELQSVFTNLVGQLNNEDIEVQLACIRTLGYLGNQAVIPILLPYLQVENVRIRVQTLNALVKFTVANPQFKVTITPKFMELLQDNDTNVRKAAADALANLQCLEAVDAIINAALVNAETIARDMGRALRSLDVEQSITKLLIKLEKLQSNNYKQFVLEMLEEVLA